MKEKRDTQIVSYRVLNLGSLDAGDLYSFEISEQSSFQTEKNFSGYANVTSDFGNAYFSIAGDAAMELPADTYFPMRHLNAILMAQKKVKQYSQRLSLRELIPMMRCLLRTQ